MITQRFSIYMPDGFKKTIYYTKTNKIKLLKRVVLKRWHDYCLDHWIWLHKFDAYRLNHEDKVKMFLDRCGTFLLMNDMKNGMVITKYKIDKIKRNETPASQISTNMKELVFGLDFADDGYTEQKTSKDFMFDNEILTGNVDIDYIEELELNNLKKYKSSNTYKLKQIYKTEDKQLKKLYKLKNKQAEIPIPSTLETKEEIQKWQNKNYKNLHGDNVYDYKTITVKGNPGIIDSSKPYVCKWVSVLTDNTFEFDNKKFTIDKSVQQYQPREVKINRKGDTELKYDMDKILCYKQNNEYYFYDMNVDLVKKDLIIDTI